MALVQGDDEACAEAHPRLRDEVKHFFFPFEKLVVLKTLKASLVGYNRLLKASVCCGNSQQNV
jgi:hypothetical protein